MSERDLVLQFMLRIDGVSINVVDMIKWDREEGRITEFKVVLRPSRAINLIYQKRGSAMQQAKALMACSFPANAPGVLPERFHAPAPGYRL